MPATTTSNARPVQSPILPWEITDAIIDYLYSDVRTLGVCSTICSEWLKRSRHHIFSTIRLWPWRAQRFFDLASAKECTFVKQIGCIEFDDSKNGKRVDGDGDGREADERGDKIPFFEAMAHSHFSCFAQVRVIAVRNVDWTTHPLHQQRTLRTRLSQFRQLERLELHGVVFHDMRELVRVVDAFPALYHLTANVTFMKMLEHTIASAIANLLPNRLRSLEIGTDDSMPVLLSGVAEASRVPNPIEQLKLHNIRLDHLKYIGNALEKAGSNLRHLSLGFELELDSKELKGNDVQSLGFSHLSRLQTLRLDGLNFFTMPCMSDSILGILERIESSFLETIHLRVRLDAMYGVALMQKFNWSRIERALLALHFFGMRSISINIEIPSQGTITEGEVESWIAGGMSDLHSRGVLSISVICEGSGEQVESSDDPLKI